MKWYSEYQREIKKHLQVFFRTYSQKSWGVPEKILWEAVEYATLSSGKYIRPILGAICYEICSQKKPNDQVLNALLSLEFIHASSLVHDDLPSLDNDQLRRGKETVWKKYGESTAILAANTLNFLAFENMAHVPSKHFREIVGLLSGYSGINALNGGQQRDLYYDKHSYDLEELRETHRKKTGGLIICSALLGATLACAESKTKEKVREYAEYLGMSFQIKDDLLDAEGDSEKTGKLLRKDIGKKGYVAFLGIEECRKSLDDYVLRASEVATSLDSEKLVELAEYVQKRER